MSESAKKRSRKSKLVPRMYVDLDELTQNDKLQTTSTVSTSHEPEHSSKTPESMPALVPFTMKVEVDSGDDDDDWWKELEEQAKKEKDAQNETQPDENVVVKCEPLEGDANSLHKEDNKTDGLEPEDWNCKSYIPNEHTEKITVKSAAKLFEKATDKCESPHCHKTDIRTFLDHKNNEADPQPEKIPGKPRKTLQFELVAKGSKEFVISKVEYTPDQFEIPHCHKTDIRTSLDDKNNEANLQPEEIPAESRTPQLKLVAKVSKEFVISKVEYTPDQFEIPHCHKTDIRTSLDDKNNEANLQPEEIPAESRTPQLKLVAKVSKEFVISKVESKPDQFEIPHSHTTDIRTSLDDKNNEANLQPEEIPAESSTPQLKVVAKELLITKVESKPTSSKKTLKRVSNEVLSVGKKVKFLHDIRSTSTETKSLLNLESPAQFYSKSVYETLKKLHITRTADTEFVIQSYKCYVCKSCWEHYYEFKEHLNIVHDEIILSIGIELVKNPFVNVIAAILQTRKSNIVFKDNLRILEDGLEVYKCLKCKTMFSSAADLESHKKSLMTCVCEKTTPCFEMTKHQENCKDYLEFHILKNCQCGWNSKINKEPHNPNCIFKSESMSQQCPVCLQTFPSAQTLLHHQTVFHTVRSDEFMLQFPRVCVLCSELYVGVKIMHYCPKLTDERNCKQCGRQFQNDLFLRLHLMAYQESVPCETCGKILSRACQQEQHNAFQHVSRLRVLYKCNICGQLFPNEFNLSKHVFRFHEKEKSMYVYTRSRVLLPKDKINMYEDHCRIVTAASSSTEDKANRANWSNWKKNAITTYYDNEIKKHLNTLATAIRHRILRDTKIVYECKLCKTSGTNISDFIAHLVGHKEIMMTFTTDYSISPKITAVYVAPDPSKETIVKLTRRFQKNIYDVVEKSLGSLDTSSPNRKIISYKCYLCLMCWEHYNGFREHLIEHTKKSDKEIYISSEILNTFVSIIALPNSKSIYPEDLPIVSESCTEEIFKCLQCKEIHLSREDLCKHKSRKFGCTGCPFRGSCFEVKAHEGRCRGYFDYVDCKTCECGVICKDKEEMKRHREHCDRKEIEFRCIVCSSQYPMKELLTMHQVAWHNVRSDEFVVNRLYTCPLCSAVFVPSKLKYHHCSMRKDKVHCEWCKRQFQNKYFLSVHAKAYERNSDIRCGKCDMALESECLRDEHEVMCPESGGTAILVFKCNLCKDMFVNEQAVVKHVPMLHTEEELADFVYHYKKMIVPKHEVVIIRDSFVFYKYDQNVNKSLNQASTFEDNIDYENSITQSLVAKPEVPTKDNTEMVAVKEEKIDDQHITENVPDIPDDTSEPDEFRLVIKEEVIDEPMEEVFEASENSTDIKIDEDVVVKLEVKSELTELEEMMVMHEYQNEKQEGEETIDQFIKNHSEITMMEIEPEILLKRHQIASEHAKKASKIYTCKKCNFSGIHSLYKYHKEECTRFKPKKRPIPTNGVERLMKIVCSKCEKEFDDLIMYLNHLKYHNVPKNVCPECKTDLECPAKLKSHVIHHLRTNFVRMYIINGADTDAKTLKIFHCTKCKDVIERHCFFQHWASHINLDEVKIKTYSKETEKVTESAPKPELQDDSNSSFSQNLDPESRKYLIQNLLIDSVRRNSFKAKTCLLCDRLFGRNHDAKRHMIEHLFDEARANKVANDGLKCPICSVIYSTKDVFKKHMRDHASLPMYQCHLCDKTFSDSSNFAKHKKVHGLRVLFCDICSRKFQCKKQLEVHIIKHMRKVLKQCAECALEFFYESQYNKHMKKYHGPEGVASYQFGCGVCKRRFTALKDKWDHEWEVHKERKTKADCPICGLKFRKFSDVKHHIRSEHNIHVSKSSYKFCKLLDTISKYNVPVEVVEELLQKETSHDGAGSSS